MTTMSIRLSTSSQYKLLRRRRHGDGGAIPKYLLPRMLSSLYRHNSNECHSPSQDHESLVTQVVQLLQSPENEWNSDQLHPLLFSSSTALPSHLLTVTRRLSSSSKALKFLDYLRANASSEQYPSLSSVFQGVVELANRETSSQTKLLELYRTSKEWNVPLNTKSARILIRRFGKARMVEESLLLFNELDPSLRSTHICNTLIGALLKSGRIGDAIKVFEEMLKPNVDIRPNELTGSIIFAELFKRNSPGRSFSEEEIVRLVRKLGENGVFLDTIKLAKLVTKLCGKRKTGLAWDLLHDVMNLGGAVEASPCNVLLTELGREGDFQRMRELIAKMREMEIQPSVVTFGILINQLCKSRRMDEALEVFEKMRVDVKPDLMLFNTLIDGLCKVGRQDEGLNFLELMKTQDEHRPNTVTYNCLIDGFCKSGDIDKAHELYNQMNAEGVVPNVVTLNTLVDGMCKHGKISAAVEFFKEIKRKGIKGNATAYTALISAFCNVNNINKAMHYFDEMMSSGCSPPDAAVFHSLISGLSLAGRMDDADLVVSKLKHARLSLDITCYNKLINGFLKQKKLKKVEEMLEEMEQTGVKPDTITYNTLVTYLGNTGNYEIASKVMRKMIKEGLVPSVVSYGALIHAYCSNGNVNEAITFFKEMCSTSKVPPNTAIYNTLIDCLCKNSDVESALSLMDDMKVREIKPNTNTYNAVFKGIRDKNMLQKAFELMDRMSEDACSPDYITVEILTEWLSAVGEIQKLRNFVQGNEASSCTV